MPFGEGSSQGCKIPGNRTGSRVNRIDSHMMKSVGDRLSSVMAGVDLIAPSVLSRHRSDLIEITRPPLLGLKETVIHSADADRIIAQREQNASDWTACCCWSQPQQLFFCETKSCHQIQSWSDRGQTGAIIRIRSPPPLSQRESRSYLSQYQTKTVCAV